ncbi:MAG TPA: DUF2269 family protein [Gaiellaceae bacterium]|jgi:uncharacterized membrane protein|nr:DUF2269 family protein [Gaiellaceae bacterium]
MTWYTFFKSIHVICAVVWVGGAAITQAYAFRILASGDGRRQAQFAQDTEVVGMRTFMPASLVLFLAAIGMMINAHWSWGQNWIVLGLIAFGLSFVIGAGFLGPESGRLAKLIASEGPESPAVKARIRRILMVSRAELVVLVTVVWNMVVKPVGLDGWFWGSIVVMVVGVAALVAVYARTEQQVAAPATE